MEGQNDAPAEAPAEASKTAPMEEEPGAARALTIHLLRMLETRVDAAGIALQAEMHSFSSRLQLRVISAALLFISLWGGIVLLAIVLPPHLRVPVLAAVIAAFVIAGVWAHFAANRAVSSRDVGSMSWFLDSLKLDMEVLSRSLAQSRAQPAPPPTATSEEATRSDQNDLAA
jgi:uncharacterized membrane protein YqjE